ncbi:MAG: DUF3048 domain-containing protein, partial [Clostridia bacterium]|nr:DUF3048 domain-containing protein [Clostridia bacterium]
MKRKSISALLLCLCLLTVAGCGKEKNKDKKPEVSSEEPISSVVEPEPEPEPEPEKLVNPLTGVKELEEGEDTRRPVAIMINNISVAQRVQTGLDKADIIYETEVEGGITRLMAVFQNVSKVGRIGTVRSCRYPYIDLAAAHNAVYIHCGQDNTYAKPHLNILDDIDLGTGNYGVRISNGLSREHTLYTNGDKLWAGIEKTRKTENKNVKPWQNFAPEDEAVTLTGGTANKISVSFSSSYNSTFVYNAKTGKYTRQSGNNVLKDYVTGKPTTVKNVFVLQTSIYNYSD